MKPRYWRAFQNQVGFLLVAVFFFSPLWKKHFYRKENKPNKAQSQTQEESDIFCGISFYLCVKSYSKISS